MVEIVQVGETAAPDPRRILIAVVTDLSEWPDAIPVASPFVTLTALDARGIEDETIYAFAAKLRRQGCAYVCCWGPDCERVHDVVDLERVDAEIRDGPLENVWTTWHDDDSLREALWFAAFNAWPDFGRYDAVLVMTTPGYAAEVEALAARPDELWDETFG